MSHTKSRTRGGGGAAALTVLLLASLAPASFRSLAPRPTLQSAPARANGKIAFASDRHDGNYEIYTANADGGDARRLTDDRAEDFDPSWSPDGKSIAFVSDRGGNLDIYVMNADGGGVRRVTADAIDQYDPSWSPDGQRIAFAGEINNTGELYVVGAAGGAAPVRLTTDGADDAFPAWSPDGRRLTFSSNRDGAADDNYEIYTIDAGGGVPQRLTNNSADDAYPAWSPDGARIAFASDRSDRNYEIYSMNAADGGAVVRLTVSAKEDVAPAWSPDGAQIVFAAGDFNAAAQEIVNSDIYTMPRDGGARANVTAAAADDITPDWQIAGATPTPVPGSPSVQFGSATYAVGEGEGQAAIVVTRAGDLTAAARVAYATKSDATHVRCAAVNGRASERCDFATTAGTLRFAAGESRKTITIPVADDEFVEGDEVMTVLLSNPQNVALGATVATTLTIRDDDNSQTATAVNPLSDNAFFVRQHYLDFLAREPDAEGFNAWVETLGACGANQGGVGAPTDCDRVHVSSGFYRSPEFTGRGYFVYRFYEAILGRRPKYAEFIPDLANLSGPASPAEFEQKVNDFVAAFAARPEFAAKYGAGVAAQSAEQFVARLEAVAGVALPANVPATRPEQPEQIGRAELIRRMRDGERTAAQIVRSFVEQNVVYDKFFFRGFVAMQYFGYLRRDPEQAGYDDWVDVLTNGRGSVKPGDYRHLIFGFVYAQEYRERFGAP